MGASGGVGRLDGGEPLISGRSWFRRLRETFSAAAASLGLRRIDDIPAIESRPVEPAHEEISAASKILEILQATKARERDDPLRSEQAIHQLIGLIDRIAESDAIAANNLRRRLTAQLFASAIESQDMSFWLLRGGDAAELAGAEAKTPEEVRDQIVLALRDGASKIRTSSALVAYLAGLADIPTELELRAPVDARDIPLLRDLTRLPSIEIVAAASNDLDDLMPGSDPRFLSKGDVPLDGREATRSFADFDPASTSKGPANAEEYQEARASTAGARILWLYGSENQSGWAYGINAQRLASRLGRFRHSIGEQSRIRWIKYDIKFSFDVLILRRRRLRKVRARKTVVRVGGAGPLQQVAGSNRDILVRHLSLADAVITLSPELERRLSDLHPRVFFIPNGIDLHQWNPAVLSAREPGEPFRAGIAASLRWDSEKDIKGYEIAIEACRLAGVPLLAVGRGVQQVPHDRMIEDFYSKIDVLVHPTAAGKEACSNVVMEALALGIPVITTRYAGMHGQLLKPWREALVVPRTVMSFAAALLELKRDGELRREMATGGRRFAERFHDLDTIGHQYARVFDIVLQSH